MSSSTVVTMIIVLGVLWGGFLCALALALRKERGKRLEKDEE